MECLISLLSFEKQNKNKKKKHTHAASNIINNRLLIFNNILNLKNY